MKQKQKQARTSMTSTWYHLILIGIIAFLALTFQPNLAQGQPREAAVAADTGDSTVPTSGDFNWHDVPVGQRVSVANVSFDIGGYQVKTEAGANIVVPFDQNLDAMKFSRSDTGDTYLVNDGAVPTLYLGKDAALENAMVPESRWTPLTKEYNATSSVYVRLAPSLEELTTMGQYRDSVFNGGLVSTTSSGPFTQMPGSFIRANGRTFAGAYITYHAYDEKHPSIEQPELVFHNYATPALGVWNLPGRQSAPAPKTSRAVTHSRPSQSPAPAPSMLSGTVPQATEVGTGAVNPGSLSGGVPGRYPSQTTYGASYWDPYWYWIYTGGYRSSLPRQHTVTTGTIGSATSTRVSRYSRGRKP